MSELRLRVSETADLTPTVRRVALRDPQGASLPAYEPGAHVVITTPAGHKRSYSLVEPGGAEPRLTRYGMALLAYSMTLDISDARQKLGYTPSVSVDEGLKRYAAWWRRHGTH